MCVAAIISNPVSLAYFQAMERANPHGAGVAWVENGELCFRRGLKAEDIYALQESGTLKFPYMAHFRWATHGDIVPELTHPFPLGPRASFGELSGTTDRVLMHNGTWAGKLPFKFHARFPEGMVDCLSDTAMVAMWLPYLPKDEADRVIKGVRWATATWEMVDGELKETLLGTWTSNEGNMYSNMHWKPYTPRVSTPEPEDKDWDFDDWLEWRYGEEANKQKFAESESNGIEEDLLQLEIEEAIANAKPGIYLPNDRVLELLDLMSEEQFQHYADKRSFQFEEPSEDFDTVNAYLACGVK